MSTTEDKTMQAIAAKINMRSETPKQFYGTLSLTMVTVALLGIGTILRGVVDLLRSRYAKQMQIVQNVSIGFLGMSVIFSVISDVDHFWRLFKANGYYDDLRGLANSILCIFL
ncbi:MAG: hypothetical protein MHMPM18_003697 [Marteilia pararefringens]